MARLYIVALPDWDRDDVLWVEGWRAAHDPDMAMRVPAHVTLVFAQPPEMEQEIATHLAAVAERFAAFGITCRRAVLGTDHAGPAGYAFLVPDQGNAALYALWDQLHSGPLLGRARPDIPFKPHLTVGRCPSVAEAESLCATLNQKPFHLSGRIKRLALYLMGPHGTLEQRSEHPLTGP